MNPPPALQRMHPLARAFRAAVRSTKGMEQVNVDVAYLVGVGLVVKVTGCEQWRLEPRWMATGEGPVWSASGQKLNATLRDLGDGLVQGLGGRGDVFALIMSADLIQHHVAGFKHARAA